MTLFFPAGKRVNRERTRARTNNDDQPVIFTIDDSLSTRTAFNDRLCRLQRQGELLEENIGWEERSDSFYAGIVNGSLDWGSWEISECCAAFLMTLQKRSATHNL